jgi:hypothetical protein
MCAVQGASDVLADLAAQAAAASAADGSVTFDRVAPCLLPEQEQVGQLGGPGAVRAACMAG